MTKREFLQAVIVKVEDKELQEYAQGLIDKMDTANRKKKSKVNPEIVEVRETILNFLREHVNEWFTAKQIAEATNLTVGKVSGNCTQMVKKDIIESDVFKIPKEGKKNMYCYYREEAEKVITIPRDELLDVE